ncbi:MAG: NYN domain-containing protein [Actinomycetota bacterium]
MTLRTLAYPSGWPDRCQPGEKPREKGIDVALAIDFVAMAVRGEYDVGILMSTDTDLKPALEAVADLAGASGPRPEVAAWSAEGMRNRRLSIHSHSRSLWCHWLDKAAYLAVRDLTDYS